MKSELAALIKKAGESLQAAIILQTEGFSDFSVSRSYYAMFYIAQAMLLAEGLSFSKHSAVIAAFGKHFAKPGIVSAEYHRFLIEAQEERNVGDYGTGPGLSHLEASEQIERARDFIALGQSHIERMSD